MMFLLIGMDGQLGQELQLSLPNLGAVAAVGRSQLDLTHPDQIRDVIAAVQPQVIINAAAYTAVDKAEQEPDLAQAINGTAPTVMAEAAEKIGATLIHLSTDYVFNGQKNTPYLEDDPTDPVSAYGRSKLCGEEGVRAQGDRHLILRTAWVYGARGHGNFVKTMLRLGRDREELRVVVDQVGSPTWTGDLAQTILQLIQTLETCSDPAAIGGIYHFTNSGVASWYDFAVAIFEEATHLGFPLAVQRVIPITTAEYPTPASRPAYSVLSDRKIRALLGTYAPHWRQGLRQMLADLAQASPVFSGV